MTTINNATPLSQMLNNAFEKFDKDRDGKLNSDEFKTFNEILKPGIATDDQESQPSTMANAWTTTATDWSVRMR